VCASVIASLALVATPALAAPAVVSTTAAWNEWPSIHVSGDSNIIYALVSTGPTDVWAFGGDFTGVGEWRTFGERFTGGTWERLNLVDRETTPAEDLLYGAAATGPRDVWTVGTSSKAPGVPTPRDLIEHWDGTSWKIVDPGVDTGLSDGLLAVATPSPGTVWAVGEQRTGGGADYVPIILHRDGTAWENVPMNVHIPGCKLPARGEMRAVVATSDSDVYAAGWCQYEGSLFGPEHDYIVHWNGSSWSLAYEAPQVDEIKSLAVAPDGQIWAGGDNNLSDARIGHGVLWHGTGTAWTKVDLPANKAISGGVRSIAASKGLIYAAGFFADSSSETNYVMAYNPATGKSHYERLASIDPTLYIYGNALTTWRGGNPWVGGNTSGISGAFLARRVVG
jgi:hypothetical protein